MRIVEENQLLTTSLHVTYRGETIRIDHVIIDTGASHTILSPDVLENIGVVYETGDPIYEAYGLGGSVPFYTKIMDKLQIGDIIIPNFEIDVGLLPNDHTGLLGLDILKAFQFIIDLKELEIYTSK